MERNDPKLIRARNELYAVRHLYINSISSHGMALSLETAALIWVLCDDRHPKTILDLGSGYSSYVTRDWAKKTSYPTSTWSVDDDVSWLKQSQLFCEQQGVDTSNFELWDSFKDKDMKFDVVVYDLGRMPTRFINVNRAIEFCGAGGVIIFDDMHKYNYGKEVQRILNERNLVGADMRSATTDSHENRHCWIAMT
jgi:hypothetical protein